MIKGIRTVADNTGDGQVPTPRDIGDGQAQVMTEGKPLLCWGRGKVPYVVQPSGHYIYRSGHYIYRTVVTISTAQWSLYLPHSGHYMYRQFNIQQFYVLPTQCIYVFSVNLRTNSGYFAIQH